MAKNTKYHVVAFDGGVTLILEQRHNAKTGCPYAWKSKTDAPEPLSRPEAIAHANRCGDFLNALGSAAASVCASTVKIVPATGGHHTSYRYQPANRPTTELTEIGTSATGHTYYHGADCYVYQRLPCGKWNGWIASRSTWEDWGRATRPLKWRTIVATPPVELTEQPAVDLSHVLEFSRV